MNTSSHMITSQLNSTLDKVLDLPAFLGRSVRFNPYDYRDDLIQSIKFPGHQSPSHRRCATHRWRSDDFRILEGSCVESCLANFLDTIKPACRDFVQGIKIIHSASMEVRSALTTQDALSEKKDEAFYILLIVYEDIGKPYIEKDKPTPASSTRSSSQG